MTIGSFPDRDSSPEVSSKPMPKIAFEDRVLNISKNTAETMDPEKLASLKRMDQALKEFKEGKFVMVMDSADREDECDLIIAAETCTKQQMAFMIKHSTGIVCLTTDKARLEKFGLHPATGNNTDPNGTNFYVSTDYLPGTTTGVSAADRCATLKAFCNFDEPAENFSKPGHMFPLCANPDGVLARGGHTESTYDFCRLSGVKHPVGALAELMHEDGEMFRDGDSREFAKKHGLVMVYVTDIICYRKYLIELEEKAQQNPNSNKNQTKILGRTISDILAVGYCPPVEVTGSENNKKSTSSVCKVRGVEDPCRIVVLPGQLGQETVLVIKGDVKKAQNVAVRIHSECFTGDTLLSMMCDCGDQLHSFLSVMNNSKCGVLVYMKGHEGRGIGLYNKIAAYNLQQEEKLDTIEANLKLNLPVDSRNYTDAVSSIKQLGIESILLHTNNPEKLKFVVDSGIKATMKSLGSEANPFNERYLNTKKEKQGHKTILETFKLPTPRNTLNAKTKVALISTTWNEYYVSRLSKEIKGFFKESATLSNVVEIKVPGHMDLISGAKLALRKHSPDVVICCGVIIRGETDSYDHQCSAISTGLSNLAAAQDVPIVQSILMCKSEEQAEQRTVSKEKNAGRAHAMAAFHMMQLEVAEECAVP